MPRKPKETTDQAPALPVSKELLDQMVTGPMTPEPFENMFRDLKKAERALSALRRAAITRVLAGFGERAYLVLLPSYLIAWTPPNSPPKARSCCPSVCATPTAGHRASSLWSRTRRLAFCCARSCREGVAGLLMRPACSSGPAGRPPPCKTWRRRLPPGSGCAMCAVDTNVLVRYLVADDPAQLLSFDKGLTTAAQCVGIKGVAQPCFP